MIAFGPVPSRRLGKSLGINNIVTFKTCPYDCVYCQLGTTKKKSIDRRTFYEPDVLLRDIERHLISLNEDHKPDYLTFVANGEPTLDISLGKEINLLKKFNIPVALITNSSLLHVKEVQQELINTDWISVKIDTIDEEVWHRINRPKKGVSLPEILDGVKRFNTIYQGILCTETMLVKGINDSLQHLEQIASFIVQLNPFTAFLSVPTRPPSERYAEPVSEEKLNIAWQIFREAGITTELLTDFEGTDVGITGNIYEDILNITAVHPLREDALQELLEREKSDMKIVESLMREGLIRAINHDGRNFYLRRYYF